MLKLVLFTILIITPIHYANAELGMGVDTSSGVFRNRCFTGKFAYAGAPNANLFLGFEEDFLNSLESASFDVGASIGGALLGASGEIKGSLSNQKEQENWHFKFIFDLKLRHKTLLEYELTPFGKKVMQTVPMHYHGSYWLWPDFKKQCGDALLSSLTEGGKLELEITLHSHHSTFKSKIVREYVVKALFMKKKKKKTSTVYKTETGDSVSIIAHQWGGDEDAFQKLFPNSEKCALDDMEKCQDSLENFLKYIYSDDSSGFSFQIKNKPALVDYISSKYSDLGIYSW